MLGNLEHSAIERDGRSKGSSTESYANLVFRGLLVNSKEREAESVSVPAALRLRLLLKISGGGLGLDHFCTEL